MFPRSKAIVKADLPLPSLKFTLAPFSIKSLAISNFFVSTATIKAGSIFVNSPFFIKNLITSRSPYFVA